MNLQLACPRHVVSGFGEHYIAVDFTGWRYFELVESEGARHADYAWPYGDIYRIYRERVDYNQVERLSVWVNNLPAHGNAACVLSPVRALPLLKATIRNPRLTIGDQTLSFPVELESGCYLEFNAAGDCQTFAPGGERREDVKISGAVPELDVGENRLRFSCEAVPGALPRVRVTVITTGDPLQ